LRNLTTSNTLYINGDKIKALVGSGGLAFKTRQASIKSFLDCSELRSLLSLIYEEIVLNLEPEPFLEALESIFSNLAWAADFFEVYKKTLLEVDLTTSAKERGSTVFLILELLFIGKKALKLLLDKKEKGRLF